VAKPHAPVQPVVEAPALETPADKVIPSFNAIVKEGQEARQAELRGLAVGTEAPATTPAPPAADAPAHEAAYDLEAEYAKLDPRMREGIGKVYYDQYNREISSRYGDLLPLVAEAAQNPQLRAALAQLGTKKELRDLITDPRLQQYADKLSKKELQDFIFGEAIPTYERYTPQGEEKPEVDPRDARMDAIEARFQGEADTREANAFVEQRVRENGALLNEFPALKADERLHVHVITRTEEEFERRALRAGVDITTDGWASRALRAGVKPPSYRDNYLMLAEVLGRTPPPAAPATSPAGIPAGSTQPQAARTPLEGKAAALKLLQGKGGFNKLASTNRGRS
jgi:hypothetical protein